MRTHLLTLLLILMFPFFSRATKPDFAYPKTVIADSEKALSTAKDGPEKARALMNIAIATSQIDQDDLWGVLKCINGYKLTTADKTLKAVLALLEAQIYDEIRRTVPSRSVSSNTSDYREWSEAQFLDTIQRQISEALLERAKLIETPIETYKSVIDIKDVDLSAYPTLYDFIVSKSIDILDIYETHIALPASLLCPAEFFITRSFNTINPQLNQILGLFAQWLAAHPTDSGAYINADLQRIDFVASRVGDEREMRGKALEALYVKYQHSPLCVQILNCMHGDGREYYDRLVRAVADFPSAKLIPDLRNKIKELEQKRISVEARQCVGPEMAVEFKVKGANFETAVIDVYDVSDANIWSNDYQFKPGARKPIASIPVTARGAVPFNVDLKCEYRFPKIGNYILVPRISGQKPKEGRYEKIHVTRLCIASSAMQKTGVWVIDPMDGTPISGAEVVSDSRNFGVTDAEGALGIDTKRGVMLMPRKGADKYAMSTYVYPRRDASDAERLRVTGFTSLAFYRPGDEMQFVAILYRDKSQTLAPGVVLTAKMRDANNQVVDTLKVATDAWGRAIGKMKIPKEGLNGQFRIEFLENSRTLNSSLSFTVSDYKLPTFKIETQPAQIEGNVVTLRGSVRTYSGFPMADASVNVTLDVSNSIWRWFRGNNVNMFETEAKTDDDGNFVVVIPAGVMEMSPYPKGLYTAKFVATTQSGESQETSLPFVMSERYAIETSIPENAEATSTLTARLVDFQDNEVAQPINYRLLKDSTEVATGTMPFVLKDIPSGTYHLELQSEYANKYATDVTIYRRNDQTTPNPDLLMWYPTDKVEATYRKGQNPWLFALNHAAHLHVTLWKEGEILNQDWISREAGMHTLDFTMPRGEEHLYATIVVIGNYESRQVTVEIESAIPTPTALTVKTQSFRDNILPGVKETWTFNVSAGDERTQAAMVLDIWNTAMDAISRHTPNFIFQKVRMPGYRWNATNLSDNVTCQWYQKINRNSCISYQAPEFQTYGYPFCSRYVYDGFLSTPMMKMASTNGLAEADLSISESREAYEDAAMTVETSAEEVQEEPRPFETPLWAFMPSLTTEADGSLTMTLTVPNENTTWRVMATAFDRKLRQGKIAANMTAAKPVMVKPNPPRFVRVGDNVVVPASVMNNDTAQRTIKTTVEIFNPIDGSVMQTVESTDLLQPKKSSTVNITVNVPSTSFIGYRVCCTSDNFTDGEQGLIAVEPSVTPLIKTQTFYIAPGLQAYDLKLEKSRKDARVTFQFCENPTWAVVTALPGLLDHNPSTANGAAHSLLSASVAGGLVKRYPEIVQALRNWIRSDRSDSTLISALQQNQDLKAVLLSATPWMMDAASDTERMTRLALLLDPTEIAKAQKTALSVLGKMQCNDGGLKWTAGSEKSSEWVTTNVLLMLADLTRIDMLPDCGGIVGKAVKYLDQAVSEQYRKYKDSDFTLYCYLRPFFPNVEWGGEAHKVYDSWVSHIEKDWKHEDVGVAAIYAQILWMADKKEAANAILNSLRERSVYMPERGMSWPSIDDEWLWSMNCVGITSIVLDAFQLIAPKGEEVERIRQWLILEKEAKDWGTSVSTSQAIASILCSGAPNFGTASAQIRVDGQPLQLDNVEQYTGSVTQMIKPTTRNIEIIRPNPGVPSYGAVYSQYSEEANEVKAAGCDDLTLERRYVAAKEGKKVTVALTLHVERDMDYVALIDKRPASFEPCEQLPGWIWSEGVGFYRENRDSETHIFIDHLPKGVYILTYDCFINNVGEFAAPPATIQSQYAPRFTAHSAGEIFTVKAESKE